MIKFYVNPFCAELIYSVAAIMKSYEKKAYNMVYTIATLPYELEYLDEKIEHRLFEAAEHVIDYHTSGMSSDDYNAFAKLVYENIRKETIYFLNIYPEQKTDSSEIVNFIDQHKTNIALFAGDKEYWEHDMNTLEYLKGEGINILVDNKLCLSILKDNGYEVPPDWLKEAEELAFGKLDNPIVARYAYALSAARIKDINMGTNTYYQSYFDLCSSEICYYSHYREIDKLVDDFLDSSKEFLKIKERIKKRETNYPGINIPERPIGYINISNFSSTLNVNEILEYGKKIYPWLFILSYRLGDKVTLRFVSAKLPIAGIIKKIKDVSDNSPDSQILLPFLENEVLNFKTKK